MVIVKIENEEYELTQEEFDYLKSKAHRHIELHEGIGLQDVAIYVGNILIGYVVGKIIDEIIAEKKEE